MRRPAAFGVPLMGALFSLVVGSVAVQPSTTFAATTLGLTKSVQDITSGSNTNVSAGDTLHYTLTWTVGGSGTANNVAIVDPITTTGQSNPSGCVLTPAPTGSACAVSSNYVLATLGNVTAPATGTVTFNTTANSGTITNQAFIESGSATQLSGTTSVTVGTGGGGTGGLTVSKQVFNQTTGTGGSGTVSAAPGNQIRYVITVTESASSPAANNVQVNDAIPGGFIFLTGSCTPVNCTTSGNVVSLNLGTINPGTSASASFSVQIPSNEASQTVTNTASVSANGTGTLTTNPAYVVVSSAPPPVTTPTPPPPCTFFYGYCTTYPYPNVYPYNCLGYPYNPPYLGYCGTPNFQYSNYNPYTGISTICGTVTAYTPSSATPGSITINGETLTLMAMLVPSGTLTAPGSYCINFIVNSNSQISSLTITPNISGANYVCGGLSPYTVGFAPWAYTPYAGFNANGALIPNPGPYAYTGMNGYYGWNGPLLVGGYPWQVSSGAYFPFQPNYGNPYCFVMNQTGYVTGSLSVIPTAAHTVNAPIRTAIVGKQHAG